MHTKEKQYFESPKTFTYFNLTLCAISLKKKSWKINPLTHNKICTDMNYNNAEKRQNYTVIS